MICSKWNNQWNVEIVAINFILLFIKQSMKRVAIKIFLSTFVVWFFSLWLSFVFWIDYPNYATSNECWQIPIRSSYSTNWTTYVTNNTYILNWYVNKPAAIWWATAWLWNAASVCVWSTPIEWWATRVSWKKDLCSSNYSKLEQYQKDLFTKYASKVNYQDPWWFDSKENVWWLQNLMKKVNCQNHRDCKLWVVTIWDFLFCNVCDDLWTGWTELDSLDPKKCPPNHIFAWTWDICCQPKPNDCKEPTIKWSVWELNWDNKQIYTWEEVITVELDYSSNIIWELTYDGVVSTQWVQNVVWPTFNDKKITLSAKADLNSNIISIQIADWAVKLLNEYNCPGTSIKLEREVLCQDRDKYTECTNSNSFDVPDPIIDYWFLDWKKCQKPSWEIDFCKCITPPQNNSCNYLAWWFIDADWCCDVCWDKESPVDWKCKCDITKLNCKNWDKPNEKTCKCECDSTKRCCGILLNTVVPFIGDCIEMTSQNDVWSSDNENTSTVNQLNAFPFLMMGLSKILVTVILIFSFLIVIAAWLMMTTWVYSEQNYKKGMERVQKVVVGLILLWASGLILKLINPSFFGG